jgi:hypothetical protein
MNQLFSNLFHNLKIEGLIFFTHGQLPKTKLSLAIVTYQSQPVLKSPPQLVIILKEDFPLAAQLSA